MSISISVRNGSISDTLKAHANSKASAIIENYNKITGVTVVLDIEKGRCKAEFIVHGKNINIESDFVSFDMYESIDKAAEKCEIQLDKYFDKVQDHKAKAAKINKIKETEE